MAQALTALGLACGGEPGARLAQRLGMPASPDSLLRAVRRTMLSELSTPRVLGVDDWALRRGVRYGTILCDLEQHRAVELLPTRSSEGLANWLKAHPGVQIISRDRGDYYIKGASEGAPVAQQVTDRWHLLKNLRETLVRLTDRHSAQVRAAVHAAEKELQPSAAATKTAPEVEIHSSRQFTQPQQVSQERRQRRMERYQQVVRLHEQKVSMREIARRLKMHRSTVRKFLAAGCFPERPRRKYRRRTDPFDDFLHQCWSEGRHNARELTEALRQRGFDGSYDMVRRRVARWRQQRNTSQGSCADKSPSPTVRCPSSNRIAWLLIKADVELTSEEETLLIALFECCAPLERASTLAKEFIEMTKQRRVDQLNSWLAKTKVAEGVKELRRFADGLEDDMAAVRAALSLPWSNGQTEGHVNRLKTLKRQMYGRANFDLLRQRFLCPS